MPIEFRGSHWMKTDAPINPGYEVTIEAIMQLLTPGDDPTVISQPTRRAWRPPFACYRLGFAGISAVPEFQVNISGTQVTLTGSHAAPLCEWFHISAVCDPDAATLYFNGVEIAREKTGGAIMASAEPVCLGSRSSTDCGGYLFGALQELRMFSVSRSHEDVVRWLHKPLLPQERGLCALWQAW
jgi:hypothetical protein